MASTLLPSSSRPLLPILAGLSVAYECVTSGLSVVVLEGGASVGSGDTLRTSACLSSALIDWPAILAWIARGERELASGR